MLTADEIRKIRKDLRLTQTKAAEKVGVTLRAWQQWEGGERHPSQQSLVLIGLLKRKKI